MRGFSIVFRREFHETLLSRRYLIYAALIFIPVGIMAWLDWVLYNNPAALTRLSAAYPEPITSVTPVIAMMLFVCGSLSFPVLIGIIHAGTAVAGDRSRGMLMLLATKPVHRWEVVAAKYLAFLAVFLPLVVASLLAMYVLIDLLGIGRVPGRAFWGYTFLMLSLVVVYTTFATLLSSIARRPLEAILGALILFIIWFMVDSITVYLPENLRDPVAFVSLSFHANTTSAFMSSGEAILRMMHVVPWPLEWQEFARSLAVLLGLVLLPLAASLTLVTKRDVHATG